VIRNCRRATRRVRPVGGGRRHGSANNYTITDGVRRLAVDHRGDNLALPLAVAEDLAQLVLGFGLGTANGLSGDLVYLLMRTR
jgi:hypothetical protein